MECISHYGPVCLTTVQGLKEKCLTPSRVHDAADDCAIYQLKAVFGRIKTAAVKDRTIIVR